MDFNKIEAVFKDYIDKYDMRFKLNKVKDKHSFRVATISEKIALRLKLDKSDIELARLIGLLHDIGRFEQLKLHNSFKDANFDHATEGANYLIERKHIRSFIEDDKFDQTIYDAIKNHNKFAIEDGLSSKSLLHSKIIRDADKVDIFNIISTRNTYEFDFNELSSAIIKSFNDKKSALYKEQKTSSDRAVFMISFVFDINFKETFDLLEENKYFENFIKSIKVKANSKDKFAEMMETVNNYIKEKQNVR